MPRYHGLPLQSIFYLKVTFVLRRFRPSFARNRATINIRFVASAFAYCLAFYLTLVLPWAGRLRYRKLKQQLAAGNFNALSRAYKRGVIQQAVLGSAVLSIVFFERIPAKAFGLALPRSWTQTCETLSIFLIAILASSLWVRYRGDGQFNRLRRTVGAILPISKSERWWFAAVGIGGGPSEELLYRGFLLYYLWVWLPGLDWNQRIIISSLIFGLGHLYQGWKGVLGTIAGGFCFAWLYRGCSETTTAPKFPRSTPPDTPPAPASACRS